MILAEDANTLFKMDGTTSESPFMLRVVPFREEFAKRFPAVAHVDGTGRLQTVDAGQELLKKLLQTYKKRTGFSLLLNTSLNIAGEPLAETPEDAIWDMLEGGLDFLVCGERSHRAFSAVGRPGFAANRRREVSGLQNAGSSFWQGFNFLCLFFWFRLHHRRCFRDLLAVGNLGTVCRHGHTDSNKTVRRP